MQADYKFFGEWLAANDLASKSINDYSRTEIKRLVEFVIGSFARLEPCQILHDSANRLIVPANADKGQLRAAVKMIEAMIKWEPKEETIVPANSKHTWDAYQ
jgi:hypothetical protein